MATEWGRKETVVWPPNSPVHTYGALFLTILCTCGFLWAKFAFLQSPLQKLYTVVYMHTDVGAMFHKHETYRLLYIGDGRKPGRVAFPAYVTAGSTPMPNGSEIPMALSEAALAQGFHFLYKGPPQSYGDERLHAWLQANIFEGKSLLGIYSVWLAFGFLTLLIQLPFSISRDVKRRKEMKYGRHLKGPVMLSPKEFNKVVKGNGMGIKTSECKEPLRIPRRSEAQHFEIIGDTGSGKTTLLMQMLRQVQERNETAIVHDPACEFVQRFYDKKRGDIILNPLDKRCPYWGPAEELRRKAEAKAIAASLYQPTSDKKGEFFTETPQKIFAHLLTFGPTPQDLVRWMSDPAEIDKRVENTELAQIIAKGAQQQRSGVLASLGLIADSLRMLPSKEQTGDHAWSATEWSKERQGWIFITSQATEREALRPLHSLWIDLLVLRLMNAPTAQQRPVWFFLDEVASLQRLPQLGTALTESRKSGNPLVLGFQGKAQMETIYGHMAETMLSQPATKILLKTTEPKAAEWMSNIIGKVEIERVKETQNDGSRRGRSFTLDRQVESLVMDSEMSGLEDKHAYLKLGNNVARFRFDYLALPKIAPAFEPRQDEDDELQFDPLTLKPKTSASPIPPSQIKSEEQKEPSNQHQTAAPNRTKHEATEQVMQGPELPQDEVKLPSPPQLRKPFPRNGMPAKATSSKDDQPTAIRTFKPVYYPAEPLKPAIVTEPLQPVTVQSLTNAEKPTGKNEVPSPSEGDGAKNNTKEDSHSYLSGGI